MNAAPLLSETTQETHLTEDQLDDHLIGDLDAAGSAHLRACTICTARVADAGLSIASFRSVSLAWGERQSATAPIPQVAASQNQWQRGLAWSLAVAACAVGLGLVNAGRHAAAPAALPETAYADQSTAPSEDQLSSDNQLLNTIDREISTSTDNSATLGLTPVNATRAATSHAALIGTSVQD